MSDEPATVEEEEVPAPEPPAEVALDAADAGTTIGPVHLRDADVEAEDVLTPEEGDDIDTLPIEGGQVESLQAAHGTNGLALAINGEVFIFSDQMTATLKGIVDRAIIGLAL